MSKQKEIKWNHFADLLHLERVGSKYLEWNYFASSSLRFLNIFSLLFPIIIQSANIKSIDELNRRKLFASRSEKFTICHKSTRFPKEISFFPPFIRCLPSPNSIKTSVIVIWFIIYRIDEKELKWKTTIDYYLLYILIYSIFMLNHFNNRKAANVHQTNQKSFAFFLRKRMREGGKKKGSEKQRIIKIKQPNWHA